MPPEEIRARGLAGASACFRDLGVANTSVDDIVRASGIARSTLYRHLGDRDDLLLAVIRREIEQLRAELLGRLTGTESIGDVLVEGVLHAVDLAGGSAVLHELITNPELLTPSVRDRALDALVEQLAGFVDPLVVVRAASIRGSLEPEIAVEHLVRTIVSLVRLDGVGGRSRARRRRYLRQTLVPVFVPDDVVDDQPAPVRRRRG